MTDNVIDSLNQKYELSSRGSRFFASIVDTIIAVIILLIVC